MKGKVESHKILDPMPNGRPSLFARDANCEKLGCGQIGCWGLMPWKSGCIQSLVALKMCRWFCMDVYRSVCAGLNEEREVFWEVI